MKRFALIVGISFNIFHLNAQSNFVPGTIYTRNGDSIAGNIDYRNWKKNPERINFDRNGNAESFTADDISGFYIIPENERYLSYKVNIDMTPDDPDKILAAGTTTAYSEERAVFMLQLLHSNSLNLYSFTDNNNKEHFFYQKGLQTPTELINHYLLTGQPTQLVHNSRYQDQLKELFQSCAVVAAKTGSLRYREKEILQIFTTYVNCTSPGEIVYAKKQDPLRIKLGIVAGIMYNNFTFKGNHPYSKADYSGNISPIAGISLDLGLSRSYDKLHIINELIYKKYKTSGSYSGTNINNYDYTTDVAFAFSYLQLNTLGRYIFSPSARVRPFANLGLSNAVVIATHENNAYTKYSNGLEVNESGISGPRKYEFSFFAGIGISTQYIIAEIRYGHSQKSFSSSFDLDIITKSPQMIITYLF